MDGSLQIIVITTDGYVKGYSFNYEDGIKKPTADFEVLELEKEINVRGVLALWMYIV